MMAIWAISIQSESMCNQSRTRSSRASNKIMHIMISILYCDGGKLDIIHRCKRGVWGYLKVTNYGFFAPLFLFLLLL